MPHTERIALYVGSFDPVTVGHLDIIERGLALFDRIIVLVGYNPDKHGCFTPEERIEMLKACTAHLPRVTVDCWSGLTVEYAHKVGACALLRGLRGASDWEGEQLLAATNAHIAPDIDTVFLAARPEHMMISSSVVRQMASFGADLTGYVPEAVKPRVISKFQKTTNETKEITKGK